MKKSNNYKTILCFTKQFVVIILLFSYCTSYGQSWQWGKSGGTTDSFNSLTEEVKSACTDIYGNVYLVSDVASTNSQVDGVPKQNYNNGFGLYDGVLASFSCTGAYRWSKVIGGGGPDFVNSVQSDALGNIYVLGQVSPSSNVPGDIPVHFDTDVILPVSPTATNENKESLFIIKYNSDGVFQWLRMPQPDDVSWSQSLTSTNATDLQVDAQGNSYSLCHLPIGVYADGAYAVTVSGFNILKYDTNGLFLGGVPIDIQLGNPRNLARMRRNHQTGDYYVAGKATQPPFGETVTVNGQLQTKAIWIAAFNSSGTFLWKRENVSTGAASGVPGIAVDEDNSVYLATVTNRLIGVTPNTPDSFNGTQVTTLTTFNIPFIVKMDANGNNLWLTSGTPGTRVLDAVIHNDDLVICGSGFNSTWQSLSFPTSNNSAYIARFNKDTNTILSINGIPTTGSDLGTALATDSKGNYYLGGKFSATMTAGSSTLVKSGGDEDFFIAKFGSTDCNFLAAADFEKSSLQGYPNPVRDVFYLSNTASASYVIYDVLGAKVQSGEVAAQGSVDVSGLSSGLYLLELKDKKGLMEVLKLVRE